MGRGCCGLPISIKACAVGGLGLQPSWAWIVLDMAPRPCLLGVEIGGPQCIPQRC